MPLHNSLEAKLVIQRIAKPTVLVFKAALLFAFTSIPAIAQVTTADIVGTVTDPSGETWEL